MEADHTTSEVSGIVELIDPQVVMYLSGPKTARDVKRSVLHRDYSCADTEPVNCSSSVFLVRCEFHGDVAGAAGCRRLYAVLIAAMPELKQALGIPIISIIRLNDLIEVLEESSDYEAFLEPVVAYRREYGVIA